MPRLRIDLLDPGSPTLVEACTTLITRAFANPVRYSTTRVLRELTEDDPVFYRRFFVAMEAGSVIGIGGVKAADWATRTHLLYLSAVTPERRGEGIARALIKARIDWVESHFEHGRILVSAARTKRFREQGFTTIRQSGVERRHLLIRRF